MQTEPECSLPRRVFIDLDGVIVDFDKYRDERGLTGDLVKAMQGAYLDMPAIPGAIEAVRSLIGMGYEVWLATKPPTGVAHAYSDKAAWVFRHLPELKRRIIITHDKGLLGGPRDFLCDDRPHKANCERFAGTLVRFVEGYHWPQALTFFRDQRPVKPAATHRCEMCGATGIPDPVVGCTRCGWDEMQPISDEERERV